MNNRSEFPTAHRKREHIETVLRENVNAKGIVTGLDRFFFDHCALPELDLDTIDLSLDLFGRHLAAPLIISSMTGGTEAAGHINRHLAEAAQAHGIAMGVGSQRAALERDELAATYRVRDVAPDILLFANFGAVQLNGGWDLDEAQRAVEMIEADALFLHLNPLQEAVQTGGDRNWLGLADRLEALVPRIGVPVVVKEVGNGISAAVARRLAQCGVAGLDVAGAGGTSWSEVEAHRQADPAARRIAHSFAGWGIPTVLALMEVARAVPQLPLIASGGLRSGVDMAKVLRLGARLAGTAQPVLGPAAATDSADSPVTTDTADAARAVHERIGCYVEELRIAAFCTGSADLDQLRAAPLRHAHDWSLVAAPQAGADGE